MHVAPPPVRHVVETVKRRRKDKIVIDGCEADSAVVALGFQRMPVRP
jgi:hypothetical protein